MPATVIDANILKLALSKIIQTSTRHAERTRAGTNFVRPPIGCSRCALSGVAKKIKNIFSTEHDNLRSSSIIFVASITGQPAPKAASKLSHEARRSSEECVALARITPSRLRIATIRHGLNVFVARVGGLLFPPVRAWLEQPHGRRHKTPPQLHTSALRFNYFLFCLVLVILAGHFRARMDLPEKKKSTKKVPLGIRLKSTRPSESRSSPHNNFR